MNQHASGPPTLAYLVGVLFRHKKKALLTFLGFITISLVIVLFFPRSFRSQAKLYVRVGRESVTLDPTATNGETLAMTKTQQFEINSVLDILDSHRIKRAVVDELGTDLILETDRPKNLVVEGISQVRKSVRALLNSFNGPVEDGPPDATIPSADEERAIKRLGQRTSAGASEFSNVVTISAKAGSPRRARDIAQSIVNAYLKEHVRLHRTEGSYEFFQSQVGLMKQRLLEKQRALQNLKTDNQILTVEGKRRALEQKILDVELAKLSTDRQLALAETNVGKLDEALAGVDKEVVSAAESGIGSETHALMRGQLYELQVREGELAELYVEDHPMVKAVRGQRQALTRILEEQPEERTQTTKAINPTWQAVRLALEEARINVTSLTAQKELLGSQLRQLQDDLQRLNSAEVEIASGQREVDVAELNYQVQMEKLEQARINSALGERDISSVNVVQPASYVREAVSPKKLVVLPAGLMMGLIAAMGIALVAENFDPTLRTAEQAETNLGIPVVMSIPTQSRFGREASAKGGRHGWS